MSGMKSKLSELNDHLFAQLDRLNKADMTPEQIVAEVKRGAIVAAIADQVVRGAAVQVAAAKLVAQHGDKMMHHLPMLPNGKTVEAKPQ
jgi:hypothetical protein